MEPPKSMDMELLEPGPVGRSWSIDAESWPMPAIPAMPPPAIIMDWMCRASLVAFSSARFISCSSARLAMMLLTCVAAIVAAIAMTNRVVIANKIVCRYFASASAATVAPSCIVCSSPAIVLS